MDWSGFFTASGGYVDGKASVIGYNGNEINFLPDSIFGLQSKIDISDKLSITGQFVARGTDNYQAEVEWAYAKLKLNNAWAIRAGRMRFPLFLLSDSLEIGYSYPWVRPPLDVYSQIPRQLTSYNGMDVIFSKVFGEMYTSLQVSIGREDFTDEETDANGNFAKVFNLNKNYKGLKITLDIDEISFQASWNNAKITYPFPRITPLLAALKNNGFQQIADNLQIKEDDANFASAGIHAEFNNFIFIAEMTRLWIRQGYFPDINGWFFTFGKYIGPFLPHITFSKYDSRFDKQLATTGSSALDKNFGLATFQNTQNQEESFSVGLRYDIYEQVALKFEWQQIKPQNNTTGLIGFTDEANLYTIALDAVF